MHVKEESLTPMTLDYARPRRRRPFNYTRLVKFVVYSCVTLVAMAAWAHVGCRWLVQSGRFRSGQPWEGIWSPVFIERPLLLGTAVLVLEGIAAIVMVFRRKWAPDWLLVLPLMFVLWLLFVAFMFGLSEEYFP